MTRLCLTIGLMLVGSCAASLRVRDHVPMTGAERSDAVTAPKQGDACDCDPYQSVDYLMTTGEKGEEGSQCKLPVAGLNGSRWVTCLDGTIVCSMSGVTPSSGTACGDLTDGPPPSLGSAEAPSAARGSEDDALLPLSDAVEGKACVCTALSRGRDYQTTNGGAVIAESCLLPVAGTDKKRWVTCRNESVVCSQTNPVAHGEPCVALN